MALFDEAQSYLQTSLALAKEVHFPFVEMYSQMKLGELFNQKEQPDQAVEYLYAALTLAIQLSRRSNAAACHVTLAESYKLMGDFQQALIHVEQSHAIEKEIFNAQSDGRLRNLQVLHEINAAKQEAEIYQLRNVA